MPQEVPDQKNLAPPPPPVDVIVEKIELFPPLIHRL
jgi:hypothetical protein